MSAFCRGAALTLGAGTGPPVRSGTQAPEPDRRGLAAAGTGYHRQGCGTGGSGGAVSAAVGLRGLPGVFT